MTLKEKFKQIDIKLSENHTTKIVEVEAQIIEKIADEFTIGFAEWRLTTFIKNVDEYTMKELLEIYKKEKGL